MDAILSILFISVSASLKSSQTVLDGQNVTIHCSSKDCPTSDITWKKDGLSLAGRAGRNLHLLSVTGNDTGEYSCHANFRKTTNAVRITVIVKRKCHVFYVCKAVV